MTTRVMTYEEWVAHHAPTTPDCERCEGEGTIDHECDCDLCEVYDEPCPDCSGSGKTGLTRQAYSRQVTEDVKRWNAFTSTTQEAR